MLLVIVCFLLIALSLSYFLLWLIYRKLFESQEQISIALTFVVSIGLVMLFVYPPMVFFYFLFFTLSYIIWWLIYRKLFKSQKHISKFLVVLGSIGLIIFYYTPYSFYLEPSYHKFKNMCKLKPEIYQFNGGKLDEKYYNKVLKYFDTDLESLDWEYIQENLFFNDSKQYGYEFDKHDGRISATLFFMFKDNRASFDNIDNIWMPMGWSNLRLFPAGNEGTGFYLSGGRVSCFEALHIDMAKFNEWERGIENVKQ